MTKIDRYKNEHEVWCYRDQEEAAFVVTMAPEVSIERVDDFIDGLQRDPAGKLVQLPERWRAELLEMRSDALHTYRQAMCAPRSQDKLDLALEKAISLRKSCELLGMRIVVDPVMKADARRKQAHTQNPGGRPASDYAKDWARLVQAKMAERSRSKTNAIKLVANEWKDEWDRPRAWTTIRDAISKLEKSGSKT